MASELGYQGGKSIFDDYVREVRPRFMRPRTFQRTIYRPGELVQCDLWEPREHVPVGVVNEYLLYLHRLGRSPNTVRAYAHHLQAYWDFLVEQKHDWRELKLTQLAAMAVLRAHEKPSW